LGTLILIASALRVRWQGRHGLMASLAVRLMLFVLTTRTVIMVVAAGVITDVIFWLGTGRIKLGGELLTNRIQVDSIKLFLFRLLIKGQALVLLFAGQFIYALH
jgi:hypothetical protein